MTASRSIRAPLLPCTFLLLCLSFAESLAMSKPVVLVSGAGGQTGQSLFRQLLEENGEYQAIGLVRSEASKDALVEAGGIPDSSCIQVVDVTDKQAIQTVVDQYDDVAAFCICTSAKPAPSGEMDEESGRPIFAFPNGDPELVDWEGQKNQIDACPAGTHVVVCSTMGGTDPNNQLNNLGKVQNEDGTFSGGNIVKWKRKAEVYLMDQSMSDRKLDYTIVHPGGLVNEPRGERRLVVGVDDDATTGTDSRTVPREDVARVMLEAVKQRGVYAGRAFDLRAAPKEESETVDTDFSTLLDSLEGKNCDYSLGEIM